jgi:hypothetical protein
VPANYLDPIDLDEELMMVQPSRPHKTLTAALGALPLFALAGLLMGSGGCAGHRASDPATQPTLSAATAGPAGSSAADSVNFASAASASNSVNAGNGVIVGGAGPVHHSERERRLAQLSTSKIAFVRVPWAKLNYVISDAFDNWFGTPPSAYQKMMESSAPDARRQGINGLAQRDFGELPPYTTRYAQIANSDADYLVRATAIRSLNRSRDRSATPLFVKALDDTHVPVKLEACKALSRMPDEAAIPGLLKILTRPDEDKDVRIAAADALGHYRNLQVARTLVATLADRDFGIAWSAHRSLTAITGRDYKYDEAAWLTYLSGPEKPFG